MREIKLSGCSVRNFLNTHHDMPQQIFEVGDITLLDKKEETGAGERRRVTAAVTGVDAGFAQVRSMAETVAEQFENKLQAKPLESGLFTPGRGASILLVKKGSEPIEIGQLGEVHPAVLERFKLTHPTAVFELDLEALAG